MNEWMNEWMSDQAGGCKDKDCFSSLIFWSVGFVFRGTTARTNAPNEHKNKLLNEKSNKYNGGIKAFSKYITQHEEPVSFKTW